MRDAVPSSDAEIEDVGGTINDPRKRRRLGKGHDKKDVGTRSRPRSAIFADRLGWVSVDGRCVLATRPAPGSPLPITHSKHQSTSIQSVYYFKVSAS